MCSASWDRAEERGALLRNAFINPIERISFVEEYAGIILEGTNVDAGRENVVVRYF
ncbi:MAG: hypothetical protein U0586_08630 [Candidatus Brocadiaceae bacterium]